MTVNYKNIGLRIREFRVNMKMTQEKLAELANLSVVHVSHIETANTNPSLSTLIKLCNALQVKLDEVVCDSLVKGKEICISNLKKSAQCDPILISDTGNFLCRFYIFKMNLKSKKKFLRIQSKNY